MIKPNDLQLELDLGNVPEELQPEKNIFPGTGIPVVINGETRNIEIFYWGLIPSWAKDISIGQKLINAKAETLLEKVSFKNSFRRRRCLIPATSFYEWNNSEGKKIPYAFSLKDQKAFMFAGLWEYWMDSSGNEVYSTTIITTAPNELVGKIHDRMPVIFNKNNCWKWMEDREMKDLQNMLVPYPENEMKMEESNI